MSVFRVEKNKGYTVMSNHHLRNHALSLKAKGLLSQMLSLPEDWDYTLQGLAQINKESIDAIREAVRELERAGYIKRSRERDERGCLRGTVYTIYEQPHAEPTPEEPTQEKPALDNPTLEKPMLDKPTLENPTQLNTESTKKRKRQSKDLSITDSIPFPSGFPEVPAQKRTEAKESFDTLPGLDLWRTLTTTFWQAIRALTGSSLTRSPNWCRRRFAAPAAESALQAMTTQPRSCGRSC